MCNELQSSSSDHNNCDCNTSFARLTFQHLSVKLLAYVSNEWIENKGRKEVPGRPALWKTTSYFLQFFNLTNLKDLPSKQELKEIGLLTKGDSLKDELIKKEFENN